MEWIVKPLGVFQYSQKYRILFMTHVLFHLQPGVSIFLIWAYHSTNDVQHGGQFPKHFYRGWRQVTLIPAATLTPTTNPATTPTRGGFLNHP